MENTQICCSVSATEMCIFYINYESHSVQRLKRMFESEAILNVDFVSGCPKLRGASTGRRGCVRHTFFQ